jgi:hypothetical protein
MYIFKRVFFLSVGWFFGFMQNLWFWFYSGFSDFWGFNILKKNLDGFCDFLSFEAGTGDHPEL